MNACRIAGAGALCVVQAAIAGPVTIQLIDPSTNVHSGWQATIFDDLHVDVVTDAVSFTSNAVVIEKFAEFTTLSPIGQPEAINIVFQQVLPDAQTVSRIVITDEIVINSTGVAWIDFSMLLLDSGQVEFDPVASAAFDVSPFLQKQYLNGNTTFRAFDGTIPAGGIWTPGMASGALFIDVDLGSSTPVTFTLKELPGIPAPGSVALLSLAGLIAINRRR